MSSNALNNEANAIRAIAVDAIVQACEGHQGVPLGMAEIATALYFHHLKHDAKAPTWTDRDRVVLSNGHGSMLLYALLYLSGYEKISLDEIKRFREFGSHCAGHPEYDPAAGIEVTTGPLGQGIANAVGMAVAEAQQRATFGADVVNHFTYAFVGDGCLQEGIGQEAIALAGHLQLSHLIFLWDDNDITDDGATNLSISEDVAARFRVANWHVETVDGHDIDAVSAALARAKTDPRPSMIACKTVIARGIPRLQGQRGGHSGRLFPEDRDLLRQSLGFNAEPFSLPDDVIARWNGASLESAKQHAAWKTRFAALPEATQREFLRAQSGELPPETAQLCRDAATALAAEAPRGGINLSAAIYDAIDAALPERLTLCADLEAPTDHKRRQSAFTAATPDGRYVHCGVREHVMGAMANGIAAHGGNIAVTVTYLAFSDYMRPAMRMAALMGLPAKFVFSHDSIGIGKNGPTHQPVEILASLRAMPNMWVLRPADAREAAECWALALARRDGPVSLVFARQALPNVRPSAQPNTRPVLPNLAQEIVDVNRSARGGYVLRDATGGARQVSLLASGSEVALALQAREALQAEGFPTAVISMPCFELFDAQPASYRDAVLPPDTVTIAVEAAVMQGWERYLIANPRGVALSDAFVGMASFGASGSAESLYQHFHITPEKIRLQALKLLNKKSSKT